MTCTCVMILVRLVVAVYSGHGGSRGSNRRGASPRAHVMSHFLEMGHHSACNAHAGGVWVLGPGHIDRAVNVQVTVMDLHMDSSRHRNVKP